MFEIVAIVCYSLNLLLKNSYASTNVCVAKASLFCRSQWPLTHLSFKLLKMYRRSPGQHLVSEIFVISKSTRKCIYKYLYFNMNKEWELIKESETSRTTKCFTFVGLSNWVRNFAYSIVLSSIILRYIISIFHCTVIIKAIEASN